MTRTENAELRADTCALLRAYLADDLAAVHAIAHDADRNAELFRSLVDLIVMLGELFLGDREALDGFLGDVHRMCVAQLAATGTEQ